MLVFFVAGPNQKQSQIGLTLYQYSHKITLTLIQIPLHRGREEEHEHVFKKGECPTHKLVGIGVSKAAGSSRSQAGGKDHCRGDLLKGV
jgi:hypothetical protein